MLSKTVTDYAVEFSGMTIITVEGTDTEENEWKAEEELRKQFNLEDHHRVEITEANTYVISDEELYGGGVE
jgi:hypothetical protein